MNPILKWGHVKGEKNTKECKRRCLNVNKARGAVRPFYLPLRGNVVMVGKLVSL